MDKDCPDEYICPITLDYMLDPVKASDNKVYEKEAIEDWFRCNNVSPITREEISKNFESQEILKLKISRHLTENNIKVPRYTPINKKIITITSEIPDDLIMFSCDICGELDLLFSMQVGRTTCSGCSTVFKKGLCEICYSSNSIITNLLDDNICINCIQIHGINRRKKFNCTIM